MSTLYCPKCGAMRNNEYPFCTECGAPYTPLKPKKGSLLPPVIFMIVMLIIGLAVYHAYPEDTTLAGTPWFSSDGTGITFDELLYTGSPELSVPEGVTGLSEECFYDCDELTTVLLPDSLTAVGDRAFAQCDALRGVKLPEGVKTIGTGAFQGCASLEAITVPVTVEAIGNSSFEDCPALKHIFFEGTKSQWQALNTAFFGTETTIYCVDGTFPEADKNS